MNSETAWNDHLSQDNLDYIRVSFEFNDGTAATPVDIPIGEYADQLSVYMASNETIIELIVNQPGEVEPAQVEMSHRLYQISQTLMTLKA